MLLGRRDDITEVLHGQLDLKYEKFPRYLWYFSPTITFKNDLISHISYTIFYVAFRYKENIQFWVNITKAKNLEAPAQELVVLAKKFMCQHFERAKLKTSELGVRKGLLIEKAPTKEMGALVCLQSVLRKCRIHRLPEGEMGRQGWEGGRWERWLTTADSWALARVWGWLWYF